MKKTLLENKISLYISEYLKTVKEYRYQSLEESSKQLRVEILSNISISKLVDLTTVMLYYCTQLTSDELCSLEKKHFTFENSRLRINYSVDKKSILLDEECTKILGSLIDRISETHSILLSPVGCKLMTPDKVYSLLKDYPCENTIDLLEHYFPIYSESDYEIIPTPLRLNTDQRFTGKGVTIAFIDSGFYPHPDIVKPENRVLAYVNIAEPDKEDFSESLESSWHGMQTSISATGNGFNSNGLYKGIASEANLVLLKVTGPNGIETPNIIKAIEWCIKHRDEYDIKIINISLGGDKASSYLESALDQVAEGAVQAGITVVVSAGNDGHGNNIVTPPATAPSVITVGGLNDNNKLDVNNYTMYWSTYGITGDGLQKPEIVAPGIWVAAPILPESDLFKESIVLNQSLKENDNDLNHYLSENISKTKFNKDILLKSNSEIRKIIKDKLSEYKIVNTYYQHVDGTSFSSPIVASVIAQMLEANPNLSPGRIKEILMKTTDKIYNVPIEKQGSGLIHSRKAVKEALNEIHRLNVNRPTSPFVQGKKVTFYCISRDASSVSVVGSFNGWNAYNDFMVKVGHDLWKLEKLFESGGSYKYKFVIDGKHWVHDRENKNIESDNFNGLNNRLNIFI